MRISRSFLVGIFCLVWLCLSSASFAENGYLLENGTRAVVEGKRLVLVDGKGRRTVAPSGRYETRDGRYTIVVRGDVIVIMDHTKQLR